MNNYGQDWNRHKAAAALLLSAHTDGLIGENQINPAGLRAMHWADEFLQGTDILS